MTGAVIFDLDATLVDSELAAMRSFIDAFRACELMGEPPTAAFFALSGTPLEQVCAELDLPQDIFPGLFRAASRRRQGDLKLFPGILNLLDVLHRQRIPMGIITGKDRARTLETMRFLAIEGYFGSVVTPDDPPAPKPSGEGVLWICRVLETIASESVVVGDSVLDVQAGCAAGAVTVGCTWGIADRASLIDAGADFITESVDSLGEYLYSKYGIIVR